MAAEGIDLKKLSIFNKLVFYLGWLHVFNIVFWFTIMSVNAYYREKKFWNPRSLEVVYISGWATLATLIISAVIAVMGIFFFKQIIQTPFYKNYLLKIFRF